MSVRRSTPAAMLTLTAYAAATLAVAHTPIVSTWPLPISLAVVFVLTLINVEIILRLAPLLPRLRLAAGLCALACLLLWRLLALWCGGPCVDCYRAVRASWGLHRPLWLFWLGLVCIGGGEIAARAFPSTPMNWLALGTVTIGCVLIAPLLRRMLVEPVERHEP